MGSTDVPAARTARASWRTLAAFSAAVIAALAVVATPASGAPADRSTSPVLTIPPPAPPAMVGSSTVVRTDNGLAVNFETSRLEPGHVVTLWVIVANAPQECEAGSPLSLCGPADHEAGRGAISVHRGTGRVVGDDGTASYGTHLRVGDTSRGLFTQDPGLLDPRGAEVLLIAKTHGPKIPGLVSEQLHTFLGGCDESAPPLEARPEVLGQPGPNTGCAEIQISVHSPPS